MRRRIRWNHQAEDELAALSRPVRQRVLAAIQRLSETGYGDFIKLRGREPEWRLRVGDWRVIFAFVDGGNTIRVLRVLHRREAYR